MTLRWRADGCPFWLLSVSLQVNCNEYGKNNASNSSLEVVIKPTMSRLNAIVLLKVIS